MESSPPAPATDEREDASRTGPAADHEQKSRAEKAEGRQQDGAQLGGDDSEDEEDDEDEDGEEEEPDEEMANLLKLSDEEQKREDDKKEEKRLAERRIKRNQEMHEGCILKHTSVNANFEVVTMAEFPQREREFSGPVKAWTDRKHTYAQIPEELIDAVFFPVSFKNTAAGTFTLTFEQLKGTVYIWCDMNEMPPIHGGFPDLNWESCGSMVYGPHRVQLSIFKKEYLRPNDPVLINIPVQAPWTGGIAFKMAPDDYEPPPESVEAVEEEVQPSCLARCCAFLFSLDPVGSLDKFLYRHNPLTPLERMLTAWHDKRVQEAVAKELGQVKQKKRHGPLEFNERQVIEVYHRLRPKHSASKLSRALAMKLSPRATFIELGWRFALAFCGGLLLYSLLAIGALSPQDVAVHGGDGSLSDPTVVNTPIATSATVRLRPIWEFPKLANEELRRVEDVIFTHNKATHVMRISILKKLPNGTLMMDTADGSKLRIQPDGMAYWRRHSSKSPEVFLQDMVAWREVIQTREIEWMTSGVVSEQLLVPA